MLLGFFLAIIGMMAFVVAPMLGRALVWIGVALAWFGMAVALQARPWSAYGKLGLQALIGASCLAIAMTVTRFSLAGIAVAAAIGGVIGAFASQWSLWISRPRSE